MKTSGGWHHGLQKLLALLFASLLAACSEVEDGQDGADGAPGQVNTGTATALDVQIAGVTISSPPVVTFSAKDESGIPFSGLQASNVRFTIAKLIPAANGEPSRWQNYIAAKKDPVAGVGTGTASKPQATAESATDGTFENDGNGNYTYTFATDITTVTSPEGVSPALDLTYDPTLTHRLAIQIDGGMPVTNAVYTWQPSTGATQSIASRDIVKTESCNECHGKLAMHGGGRIETRYCVTCHNPGTADPESGHTVDFKVMIHKIHRGATLPSVVAGTPYVIYGYKSSVHDFSDVVFPDMSVALGDTRNCTKCHDGADEGTPDGDNWKSKPSIEACGSCHDNIDFTKSELDGGHGGGAVTNADCATCHGVGMAASTATPGDIAASHSPEVKTEAAKFQYSIEGAVFDTATRQVTVTFSISDPTNGDTRYTLGEDAWTQGSSALNVDIAWDTAEYTNTDANSGVSKALQLNVKSAKTALDAGSAMPTNVADFDANADGSFTIVSTALPAGASGTASVAIEGRPVANLTPDVTPAVWTTLAVKNAQDYAALTDTTAQPRREVVATAKCQQCHETLSFHGKNRVDEVGVCVTCHNPNNTDIAMRTFDSTTGLFTTTDGKTEESIDFKRLIHGIHAGEKSAHGFRENGLIAYGHGNSTHDYSDVRFPGILSNCETCHEAGTYELPLSSSVSGSTIATGGGTVFDGVDTYTLSVDADPTNDIKISPTASVCSSCHDSSLAQTHMEQNGADFAIDMAAGGTAAVETCTICHGPGRLADVKTIHGIN